MSNVADKVNDLGIRTVSKVKRHFLPFVILMYLISYLDRSNISIAALTMNKELAITTTFFGFAISIFFIGYIIFEIPSNMMLHRVGAQKWLARIMVSWGIIAVFTMFVQNLTHLMAIRVLLGIAEAGFFPGIVYFLTRWFPAKDRALALSLLIVGAPLASLVGNPIGGLILDNVHWLGLSSWRWLYFLEGVPAIIIGIITWFYLTDRPEQAKWLSQEEKDWLINELDKEEKENAEKADSRKLTVWQVMKMPRVWQLAMIYFGLVSGGNAMQFWMPTIIKEFSSQLSSTMVGFASMIPWIFAIVAMVLWAQHSDKTGERKYHVMLPFVFLLVVIAFLITVTNPVANYIALIFFVMFAMMSNAPFNTIPAMFLTGEAAAIGFALISSVANICNMITSTVIGILKTNFGNTGVYGYFAVLLLMAIILSATLPRETGKELYSTSGSDKAV